MQYIFQENRLQIQKKTKKKFFLKQGNIFCFSPKILRKYCSLPQSKLEIVESVDMNRYLENDVRISMVLTKYDTVNVDTYNDLKKVRKLMK